MVKKKQLGAELTTYRRTAWLRSYINPLPQPKPTVRSLTNQLLLDSPRFPLNLAKDPILTPQSGMVCLLT